MGGPETGRRLGPEQIWLEIAPQLRTGGAGFGRTAHPFARTGVWRANCREHESCCASRRDGLHSTPGISVSLPNPIMKIRLPIFALVSALALMPVLQAQDAAPKKMGPKEPQTELGDKMEKMQGAYRRLGRQIADATKNEDSLKLVAVMRENAEAALKLVPAFKAEQPADKQEKFMADYNEQMKSLIGDIGKLETALKANNNDEAANVLKTLKTDMDDGHKEFRKPRPAKKKA